MLGKILPLVLLAIGTGAGVGAGIYLRPVPQSLQPVEIEKHGESQPGEDGHSEEEVNDSDAPVQYIKMNNQFVVPVVKDSDVIALVVLALSLEVPENRQDEVYRHEPKLRDSFLQVLFDHANVGGFDGAFTSARNLGTLRAALTEMGQKDMGKDAIKNVLITEIARQDY
tara:strand:- start:978 stop:1484 length:507 start_codon:yes stop_codon:yes gene_type:complete